MGKASITIAVDGKWNGKEIAEAQKQIAQLGKAAGASAKSVAGALSAHEAQSRKLAVAAASTSRSTTQGLTNLGNELVKAGGKYYEFGEKAQAAGAALTKSVTLPLAAIGAYASKAAVEYDTALANLRKTSDLTESQLESLGQSALELSTTQPVSASAILNVEALGAQLGIAEESLESFSMVANGLDIATNMDAETAATQMARFANITGMADEEMENYASTLVALGNNMATTESEISNMAIRIASAGAQAGMSDSQILGLAGAMSSLGIKAEMGGSAVSQVFVKIGKACSTGGAQLEAFASAAGMSADEFRAAWEEDAAGAFDTLIEGLGKAQASGDDLNVILSELGITEIRQSDVMRRLAGSTEAVTGKQSVLGSALELANGAWEENTALTQEVEDRNQSLAARLQVLKNKVDAIATQVGVPLVNALIDAADACQPLIDAVAAAAESFSEMDEGGQRGVLMLAALAAGVGPLTSALGAVSQGFGGFLTSLGRAVQDVGVYGDALNTVDGAMLRVYSGTDSLAAKLGVQGNKAVQAAGDVETYVKAWEEMYSAGQRAEQLTQRQIGLEEKYNAKLDEQQGIKTRLAEVQGQLNEAWNLDTVRYKQLSKENEELERSYKASRKSADGILNRLDAVSLERIEVEADYAANKKLIDGWTGQGTAASKAATGSKKVAQAAGDAAEVMADAADAAADSSKSMGLIGKAGQAAKNAFGLAAGSVGAFVSAAAPMVAVGAAVAVVAAVAGDLAAKAAEAAEREKLLADASATFAEVADQAAASAQSQAEGIADIGERARATTEGLVELNQKASETMREFETDSATLGEYVDTIVELGEKGNLTASEQEKLKAAVKGYNDITGQSVDVTDAAAGKLSESTDAILENADAWRENAEAQAYQELMAEYTEKRVDAELQLGDVQSQIAQKTSKLTSLEKEYNEAKEDTNLTVEERLKKTSDLSSEMGTLRDEIETLSASEEELSTDAKSAAQSEEELAGKLALLSEEGQAFLDALNGMEGMSGFGETLSGMGLSMEDFAAACLSAEVSTEQLSAVGAENLSALAEACKGDMDVMAWAVKSFGGDFDQALESNGSSMDAFAAACSEAGISSQELNAIGSESLSALAASCKGNTDMMVWAIQHYNDTPLLDKDGKVQVDSAELMDANGKLYTWNGTELIDKETQAKVDYAEVVDGTGAVLTYDSTRLDNKWAYAEVDGDASDGTAKKQVDSTQDSIESLEGKTVSVNADGNYGSAAGKIWDLGSAIRGLASKTVDIVANVFSKKNAAGGIRPHADGGIAYPRYHAAGAVAVARSAVPLDIVGEDGAEAIVPLTNRRYSMPFVRMIAGEVRRELAQEAAAQASRAGAVGNTYYLTIDGASVSPDGRALELVRELVEEFGSLAGMGGEQRNG